jgi:hypothetical protein
MPDAHLLHIAVERATERVGRPEAENMMLGPKKFDQVNLHLFDQDHSWLRHATAST